MDKPLEFNYDEARDILTIEGIAYSGGVFRELGFWMPIGMKFSLVKRENGTVWIQREKPND